MNVELHLPGNVTIDEVIYFLKIKEDNRLKPVISKFEGWYNYDKSNIDKYYVDLWDAQTRGMNPILIVYHFDILDVDECSDETYCFGEFCRLGRLNMDDINVEDDDGVHTDDTQ